MMTCPTSPCCTTLPLSVDPWVRRVRGKWCHAIIIISWLVSRRKADVQSQYYSPHPDQYPDLINVTRYNTLQQQPKRKPHHQLSSSQRDYSSLQRQARTCKPDHFSIKQQNNDNSNQQQYFSRQTQDFSDCITPPPPPPLDWQSPDPDPHSVDITQSYSGGTNEVWNNVCFCYFSFIGCL